MITNSLKEFITKNQSAMKLKTIQLRRMIAGIVFTIAGAGAHAINTCSTAIEVNYSNQSITYVNNTTGVANDNGTSGAVACGTAVGTAGQHWYKFVWPGCSAYNVNLSTDDVNTNFDTKIHVYSGTCGALICVAGDDDSGNGTTSVVNFTAQPGETYYIRIGGFSANTGTYVLSLYAGYGSCNDPSACNYQFDSDWNDCSCCYENCVTFSISNDAGLDEGYFIYVGFNFLGPVYNGNSVTLCLEDYCDYYIAMYDMGENGWNNAYYSVNSNGVEIQTGTMPCLNYPYYYYEELQIGMVCGCTNPVACNYNPAATSDDGSCEIVTNGECTFPMDILPYYFYYEDNTCEPETPSGQSCGANLIKDLWYRFTYDGGIYTIATHGESLIDTRMAVYDYCGGEELECNDDLAGYDAAFSVSCADGLVIGHNYILQIGGYGSDSGTFQFSMSQKDIEGCNNPIASNYDPCANINDGSCDICPGDFTGDLVINVSDMLLFMGMFGNTCTP